MKMKLFVFVIFLGIAFCLNYSIETFQTSSFLDTNDTDARKRYGYGSYSSCNHYEKTFLCMTNCQSLGYTVYRLNSQCKCTCHEMRSTIAHPYYKWLTTGTPRKLPTTRSPRLYDIIGTLSPHPTEKTTIFDNNTCLTLPSGSDQTEVTPGSTVTLPQGNETGVTLPQGNQTEVTSAQGNQTGVTPAPGNQTAEVPTNGTTNGTETLDKADNSTGGNNSSSGGDNSSSGDNNSPTPSTEKTTTTKPVGQ